MTCPHCTDAMWAVEYRLTSQDYDGASEYACPHGCVRIGRWSKRVLKEGEIERRHGGEPVREDAAWRGVDA